LPRLQPLAVRQQGFFTILIYISDFEVVIPQVSPQRGVAFVIAPGEMKPVVLGCMDLQFTAECRRRIAQADQFKLVTHDYTIESQLNIAWLQGGAIDFLVAGGRAAVSRYVIIFASE
jgi:hypothetical protein